MSFTPMHHGPALDADESRLRQLENLIAEEKRRLRAEAERRAEEERQQREREAARPSYTLDQLEAMRDEMLAAKATREHHLQVEAGRDAMLRRAEQMSAEIQIGETKLQDLRAQRDAILTKLG